jgi:hypothetical protein
MLSVSLLLLCLKYTISPTPHFENKKVTDHDVTEHRAEPFMRIKQTLASQEISRTVWNPKVRYRIHGLLPPVSILSQTNPVHALIPLPEDLF